MLFFKLWDSFNLSICAAKASTRDSFNLFIVREKNKAKKNLKKKKRPTLLKIKHFKTE